MRTGFILAGIGAALIIILAIQFWPDNEEAAEVQPALESETSLSAASPLDEVAAEDEPPSQREQVAAVEVSPEPVLPPLRESDDWVRDAVAQWPLPQQWLARDELIERLSVVLQNAAQGRLPRRQLSFLTPSEGFPVLKDDEVIFLDPAGYTRYTPYLDLLEKIPPARAAQLLTQMEPLLMEAFALLGERTPLQNVLREIAGEIEALPEIDAPVILVQPNVMYLYADPELESRSEFDKQLLRMGPDNVRRLKAYVADFMASFSAQTR